MWLALNNQSSRVLTKPIKSDENMNQAYLPPKQACFGETAVISTHVRLEIFEQTIQINKLIVIIQYNKKSQKFSYSSQPAFYNISPTGDFLLTIYKILNFTTKRHTKINL